MERKLKQHSSPMRQLGAISLQCYREKAAYTKSQVVWGSKGVICSDCSQ
jgi:hypothetical protein